MHMGYLSLAINKVYEINEPHDPLSLVFRLSSSYRFTSMGPLTLAIHRPAVHVDLEFYEVRVCVKALDLFFTWFH
jgi:hypothetical protein